jgi:hypothetical protein
VLVFLLFTINTNHALFRNTLAEPMLMYSSIIERFDTNEGSKDDFVGSRTWLAFCLLLPGDVAGAEGATGQRGVGLVVS